jgi:lipid-A-disaccharide synthase
VSAPRILISAGEPSGDLHGSALARALKARWPDAQLYGLGGPRMQREGVELLAGLDQLAVLGFAEIVRHLPYFIGLLRRMRRELEQRPPDLVIPIDYPGFNLRLARRARQAGVPVLYYIAPQVWAWHRSRVAQLARDTDRLAVILPFEEVLFREAGADAHFVGHPLLDTEPEITDRAAFCAALGIDPAQRLLALFPGSRAQEVGRHLELFSETASLLQHRGIPITPVIAAVSGVPETVYGDVPIPRTSDTWSLLHHAAGAVVKSGTGTLQAALAGTPFVVAYRMHRLSYVIARRVVEVPHIALVNLVAGDRVVPELIQDAATPAALADALAPVLEPGPARERMTAGLKRVRAALTRPARTAAEPGQGGAAQRVAALAAELVENAR